MSADLVIDLGAKIPEVQNVSFQVTDRPYDQEPCVRLYCTQHRTAFTLQIRGLVPLTKKGGIKTPQPLIASASLSWNQLVQIADYVGAIRREMADAEAYNIYPAEVIRQGLESNADEFSENDRSALVTILAMVEGGAIKAARDVIDKASETVRFYTINPD